MGLFNFWRKDKVIDLGEKYRQKESQSRSDKDSDSSGLFSDSALGSSDSPENSENANQDDSGSAEEKKKRLAKRLLDIAIRLDENSTQIYHLQKRVELLEKKTGIKFGN